VQFFLDTVGFITGLMQVGTVVFLLLGAVRKYAFVLGFCALQVITSLLEVGVIRKFGRGKQYGKVFWTDEIVMDLLLFLILILLTYRAMEGSAMRGAMGRILAVVTAIVMALPFFLFKGAFVKMSWFDHTSQMLNFGAAILNLALWTALLGSRKRDTKLLTVSAAFGILATGAAISFGLRQIFNAHGATHSAASQVFVFAHLCGAFILCWAFRPTVKDGPKLVLRERAL
jgi:hypothetical protein